MRKPSVQTVITLIVVGGATLFVIARLEPGLLLLNTTPTGGDTGAHVWGPAYLKDHLLTRLRLSGWSMDWFAGLPVYAYYFPLPALLIVLLDLLLPYSVAFKLVTVLGAISLPFAAYVFGRLSSLRFPGPPLLAVSTLPFLFDTSFTIYGGNIPSILAGEFSYSIGLSLGLVYLGVVVRGLETGRHRSLAAVLLALTALTHLIPAIFVVGATGILLFLRFDRHRLKFVISLGAVAFFIAAFWAVPLIVKLDYANDMGWTKITDYFRALFPAHLKWIIPLAGAGAISAVGLRLYSGMSIAAMALVTGLAFVLIPEGRLWNARLLPFWFLCLYLLAGLAIAEVGRAIGNLFSGRSTTIAARLTPILALAVVLIVVGGPLRSLPSWLPIRPGQSSFIPSWAQWNFAGYERKDKSDEYFQLIETVGSLPCGRAMWEPNNEIGKYGTPMALMLLPYWTGGCIKSMEGLYFESAASTPFHWINASELAVSPSNPQRGLPYQSLNLDNGIRHLELFGVRYYMAFSEETKRQARSHEKLRRVAVSGEWEIFEIPGVRMVEPLEYQPAVFEGIGASQKEWLPGAVDFYLSVDQWDVFPAAGGHETWPRISPGQAPPRVEVEPATVSKVRLTDETVSFQVDKPGVPVLVKVSYFPNWKVRGAEGPWRVAPNLMVVLPTARQVELRYGYLPVDVLGLLLTVLGIYLAVRTAGRQVRFPPGPMELERMLLGFDLASPEPVEIFGTGGKRPEVTVVMPAYNESEFLAGSVSEVVAGLRERGRHFEVLIAENGSTDETLQTASDLASRLPEVRVGRLPVADYGQALRAGLIKASGEFVVNFDVDHFDLTFFDNALGMLGSAGGPVMVLGSKRAPGSNDKRSRLRRWITSVFSNVLKYGFRLSVTDTHGMKAFRRRPLLPLAGECRFVSDLFDTELVLRTERAGLGVEELPVTVEEIREPRTPILLRGARTTLNLIELRISLWAEGIVRALSGLRAFANTRMFARALAGGGALAYAAAFSYWTVRNHYGFGTFSFDLGIWDQGAWLLSRFDRPFVTVMGVHLFGDHTSFIMLFLAPIYWVFPSASVLLVAQSVALAAGAIPVFLIARRKLGSERLAALISIAYLAHPAIAWTSFEQFHPDAFEVPLVLFAFYFMLREKWLPYFLFLGAALLVKEDVPLMAFTLGLYVAWKHSKTVGFATSAVSALWFLASVFLILPHFNDVGTLDAWRIPSERFGGIDGLFEAIFTRPWELAGLALSEDKPWYLWQMFGAFALLALLSPFLLVAAGPLLSNLLSTFWYQYHIQYHYHTLIVPVLITSAIFAIYRFNSPKTRNWVTASMLAAALIAGYLWGPVGRSDYPIGDPKSPQAAVVNRALARIPEGAAVSAHHGYVPHLTHRKYIFDFPNPWRAGNWGDFSKEGQPLPNYIPLVDYVLINDGNIQSEANRKIYEDLLATDFSEVFDEDGVMLLRRVSKGPAPS